MNATMDGAQALFRLNTSQPLGSGPLKKKG